MQQNLFFPVYKQLEKELNELAKAVRLAYILFWIIIFHSKSNNYLQEIQT